MPVKKTKTTLKTSQISEKKVTKEVVLKKNTDKTPEKGVKKDVKKVVVKRRKVELKPTKASAVAIASQANRAKKQAFIEKVSSSEVVPNKKVELSDNRIPLWVWMFFGCSLILFCVSFYQAIIRPQIEKENIVVEDSVYQVDKNVDFGWVALEMEGNDEVILEENQSDHIDIEENQWVMVSKTPEEVIEQFFECLSNRDFDGAFDLMIPALVNYNDIRAHFTSYRMDPFLDWIEWWMLVPENFKYINSPSYWKDVYNFDLSYVLKSNQEKYDETWEFTVSTQQGNPQISSIRCISSKCSYHPIFWPENFGLTK